MAYAHALRLRLPIPANKFFTPASYAAPGRPASLFILATVQVNGKTLLLLPEFELTDFPTDAPIGCEEAERLLRTGRGDVAVGGFVEISDDGKRFSSCLVVDANNVHLVRKCAPQTTEAGMLDGSGEEPESCRSR